MRVGTRNVTLDTFLVAAKSQVGPGEFPRSGSGWEAMRDAILKDLAVEELLLIEAEARGLTVSDAEIDAEVAASALGLERADLERTLIDRFGSVGKHRTLLARRLRARKADGALRAELGDGIEVTDAQRTAAQERFADVLHVAPRLHARQIYTVDAAVAAAAHAALRRGEPWDDVATRVQGDVGDLGWMSLDAAPELLVEATRDLAPGQVAEPARSPLGHHLFQLLEREAGADVEEAAVRAEIDRLLRDETVGSRLRARLGALSDAHPVAPDEAAMERLRCCRLGLPYVGPGGAS